MDYPSYNLETAFVNGISSENFHIACYRSRKRRAEARGKDYFDEYLRGREIYVNVPRRDDDSDQEYDLSAENIDHTIPRHLAFSTYGDETKKDLERTMEILAREIDNLMFSLDDLEKPTLIKTKKKVQYLNSQIEEAFKDFVVVETSYLMLKQIVVNNDKKLYGHETELLRQVGQENEPFAAAWSDDKYPMWKYLIFWRLGKWPTLDFGPIYRGYNGRLYMSDIADKLRNVIVMDPFDFKPFVEFENFMDVE